jgi:DNA-binding NarL/FixJ family response regulator
VKNQREFELATVLIADDHFTVLESVVPMLKPFFNVVGTASDGKGAVEAESRLHPDVVILDISMPVMSGIDAAKHMRKQGSNARIIFLTVHEDVDILAAAKTAGGKGYVLKSRLGTDLIRAIKDALADKDFVSQFSPE